MASEVSQADFCFVHAADLHLDTPFKGVSATAPHVGAALCEASLEAFDALVSLCLERGASFLVLAGDIYDGAERGMRAQLRFRDGLKRLSDAGIRTFVVHGNHDPLEEGWAAVGTWPELVHVFSSREVEAVEVEVGGRVIATVQGISYAQREMTENLALRFSGRAGRGLQVGVLHCNVAGAGDGHQPYSPCSLDQLRQTGLDYWALGHIHARAVLSEGDGGFIVYPGNLQARSPKPSELGSKGATVVEVRGGRVDTLEHVPCDRVRFCPVDLDVAGLEGAADVRSELADLAMEELARAGGRSVIVRATLHGRGPAHEELARDGVLSGLLDALRDGEGHEVPFVWWDRIENDTRPVLDLDELASADDFAGDLLKAAEELARGGLEDEDLDELIGKMPSELARMAREIAREETDPSVLAHQAAVGALDRLEVGI